MDGGRLEHVTSADGTPIGVWTSGEGPPLVLVHGATADHTRWRTVLPLLESHCTTCAIDRRGRGASGDADEYTVEREGEDVAAVIDDVAARTGGPVDLLGHSFGGLCALEGALRTSHLRRLVLYEPEVAAESRTPPEILDRFEAMLADGRRDEALTMFFAEVVQVPPHELERLRSLPAWKARVEAAHTLPRELRALDTYRLDPERFTALSAPAMVLVGGDSPEVERAVSRSAVDVLPDSRLVELAGQRHLAMDTAPELFTKEVLGFLQDPLA